MTIKINLGGKERSFVNKYGVQRKVANALGISFAELETYPEKNLNDFLVNFYFFALEKGAKEAGQKWEHTVEDVQEWLDDLTMDEFAALQQTIINTKTPKKK